MRIPDIRTALRSATPDRLVPVIATFIAFGILFWAPFTTLLRDWWSDPEAGHGLLLGPIALILAWKRGIVPNPLGQRALGIVLLIPAVLMRYVSGLAAELFTMRGSMILALVALALSRLPRGSRRAGSITVVGLFGAALLYGDGAITPAISVLSAVEGLQVATDAFEPFILPIAIGILIGLFAVQRRGTAGLGAIFGPAMLLWFALQGRQQ